MLKYSFELIDLELMHTFNLAVYSRKFTPAVILKLEYEGITGWGEASLPPYLGETHQSVSEFYEKIDFRRFNGSGNLHQFLDYISFISEGNFAAKASVDLALHDLVGKMEAKTVRDLYNIQGNSNKKSSFTIGISSDSELKEKLRIAEKFEILKVKIGTDDDKGIIKRIRKYTNKKIYADANQGWNDLEKAVELTEWLAANGVELIEQPFPEENIEFTQKLKEKSSVPIIADESIRNFAEMLEYGSAFDGINIKLMKAGGIYQALKMIKKASESGLKIMLGCMTETSCGISAAAQLLPLADYVDLDGNLLLKKDLFSGLTVESGGVISLSQYPGLGVERI